ncbi:MAG: 2-hydroxy-3-oxopropionate reductase [Dehalococcoidia bacterium]|nr:2-hydroxy-3-oxopropionate reductase [Dehalococcoidia bacterium]
MKRVGFVGLGIMGKPMAKNLLGAGFELMVHSRSRPPVDEVAAHGATAVGSPSAAAAGADAVVTMLPDGPDSELVILGTDGVLAGSSPGSLIIDMSSIAPAVSQRIARACEEKGVDFLDAPVSGGEPMAVSGDLAIMVGGRQEVFDRASPLFEAMGKSWVLCGDYGAGNTTKLANQIIVAANIEAVGEALVLAKKAGLDPQKVFDAIRGGLAGSNVLNAKGPMMISGNFAPGFRIRLHQKDLRNALLTAGELSVPLPVTALVQQMVGSLVNDGKAENDHSSIANFIEGLAKTTIASES